MATEGSDPTELLAARRWLIVGASGTGKSTLATELSRVLGLAVVHLDSHFWKDGWVETPNEEFDGIVTRLCAADEWIMDGNYSRTLHLRLPRAQVVVLLDLPTPVALWGIYRRALLFRGRSRPDLPDGCPEQWPDAEFVRWVVTYRARSRPKVLRRIAEAPHVRLVRLRSRREIRRFMDRLREAVAREGARA